MSTVVIYIGGDGPEILPDINGDVSATIAADSGLHLADSHGVNVNLVVGDMDSVDLALLKKYEEQETHISRFPNEKDETDFELAIMAAKNYVADSLVVIGGGGGRLDHLLACISVLAGPQTENWTVDMFTENEHIYVCRPGQSRTIAGEIGSEISLVPEGGNAIVSTTGLKWELENSTLEVHSARGISNVIEHPEVTINSASGSIVVIAQS